MNVTNRQRGVEVGMDRVVLRWGRRTQTDRVVLRWGWRTQTDWALWMQDSSLDEEQVGNL